MTLLSFGIITSLPLIGFFLVNALLALLRDNTAESRDRALGWFVSAVLLTKLIIIYNTSI